MTRKLPYALLALLAGSIPTFAQVNTGTYENALADFNSPQLIAQSFMGTLGTNGPVPNAPSSAVSYWNTINIRHRNGSGDGNVYGAQFAVGLSQMTDRMFFRVQRAGIWSGWREPYTAATPRVLINNAADDGSTALQVNGTARSTIVRAAREGSAEVSSQVYLTNPDGTRAFNLQLTEGDFPGLGLWRFDGTWHEAMRIASNGNVSIGTTDPKGYKLAVAGSIIAEKVKVKLVGAWPDYVFDQNYNLPGLDSLEMYIRDHKRLPGTIPAGEVERNGLDVAEMQRLQMQKIEELTLYIINLNKKIAEQQKEINQLKEQRTKGL
jgi:hypothetical protein